MTAQLKEKLDTRERRGNLRQLLTSHGLIDFASNDYLGLARSSSLAELVCQEWERYGHKLGSTGSRLLTGNSAYAEELEDRVAAFHGYESGCLFNCGYMANLGLLSAVAGRDDVIFFDAAIHASTHDGIRLSPAKAFPFKHNDIQHLESRLKACCLTGNLFICIESIYSTDGSVAPLQEICELAERYGARLIVDEAHATGVCGQEGRGCIAELKLNAYVFAHVVTFGKALGAHGAIVLGSSTLKKALINFATSYIYTTALPFHTLAAIKCSYELFPKLENERGHLQKLIAIFRQSPTHIQYISVKGNEAAKSLSRKLAWEGFDVRALVSPTVRKGRELLRICLHAFNTEEELRKLCLKLSSQE